MDSESIAHGSRFISRAVKTENPLPRSFFAPKPNGNSRYAGYPWLHSLPSGSEVGLYNCTDTGLSVYNYFAVKIGKSNHQRVIEDAIVKGLQINLYFLLPECETFINLP